MSESKSQGKVVIVGAGVAGLATGIYCAMNNYNVLVLERSRSLYPFFNAIYSIFLFLYSTGYGGICQGWVRKGYHCDGCCHWVVGSNSKPSVLGQIFRETGLSQLTYVDPDEFVRYEAPGKPPVIFYRSDLRLMTLA